MLLPFKPPGRPAYKSRLLSYPEAKINAPRGFLLALALTFCRLAAFQFPLQRINALPVTIRPPLEDCANAHRLIAKAFAAERKA
jgi:hypothetical protein